MATENFGCGSSREHAVWALTAYGIRAVIAPSFGDIFFNNCFKVGVLPVVVTPETAAALRRQLHAMPGATVTVDLEAQSVTAPDGTVIPFEVDAFRRQGLLRGQDEIALTLEHAPAIAAFERPAPRGGALADPMKTPLSVYLPFNRDCLRGGFVPAKSGASRPPARPLAPRPGPEVSSSRPPATGSACPQGERPAGCAARRRAALWLGHADGDAVLGDRAAQATPPLPAGLQRETLVPMQGTRLPDELLSLGGMAMQAPLVGEHQRPLPPLRRAHRRASPASGASSARAAATSTTRTCIPP